MESSIRWYSHHYMRVNILQVMESSIRWYSHHYMRVNILQVMESGIRWYLRSSVNSISRCNPLIAPITFGKKHPTFSNSEAKSSNTHGFGHQMIWCKLAIRPCITTSVHFRNVLSDIPNSCDNVRKLLTNAKKIIIIWLIYYFVWFISRHKSSQLFCAC